MGCVGNITLNNQTEISNRVKYAEDVELAILEGYWQNLLATFQANDSNIKIINK